MHGNVWEWCFDRYGAYTSDPVTNPMGASFGAYRVFRGGGWVDATISCRSAKRFWFGSSVKTSYLGLRLCLTHIHNVGDVTPPTLTLLGDAEMTLQLGEPYTEPGYTATDNKDGDLTSQVRISGDTVDVQTPGVYIVSYTVLDSSGNAAEPADRWVTVVDGSTSSPGQNITIQSAGGLEMLWVKPGTFTMGSPNSESDRWDQETQHEVTLTQGFWLGKHEVTQSQYQAVMGKNPSYFRGNNLPVEVVSWNNAMEFCEKVQGLESGSGNLPEGYAYTLPTESQWEYACRAGTTGPYAGDNLDDLGWYRDNSSRKTHDVGLKAANPWGFYDMHGNVEEWCADWYSSYPSGSVTDPTVPASGSYRVGRGGSWRENAGYCRSAYRNGYLPGYRYIGSIGFRLCLSPAK